MSHFVEYVGDGTTDTYDITFPFLRESDIQVFVDDTEYLILATDGQPTPYFDFITDTQIQLTPTPANATAVLVKRATEIDEPIVEFAADSALYADDVGNATNQSLYAIEELKYTVDNLGVASGGGGGGGGDPNTPDPTGVNQFIASTASGPDFVWSLKSVAQMQSLLGIASPVSIPSPLSGSRFIVTNASTNTYELKTLVDTKSILGINTEINALSAVSGRINNFVVTNGSGSGFQYSTVANVKSLLGLASAAFVNLGTAAGAVPQLVTPASGSVGALPTISGENLTNVMKSLEYVDMYVDHGTTTGTALQLDSATAWTVVSTNLAVRNNIPSSGVGSWAAIDAAHGCQLAQGTYRIQVVFKGITGTTSVAPKGQVRLRVNNSTGTVECSPFEGRTDYIDEVYGTAGAAKRPLLLDTVIKVTSANAMIRIEAKSMNATPGSNEKNYCESLDYKVWRLV